MPYEAEVASQRDSYEVTLKRFDSYIVSQVHRLGRIYSQDIHPAVLDLELDEVIQKVRIKFWQALKKREVYSPYTYIKFIIQSEFIDMRRRRKPYLLFSLDEEQADVEIDIANRHTPDPAETVVQQIDASNCLEEVIQAVLALPPRQQYAMICSLKDHVDDFRQLIEAFRVHNLDIQVIEWPLEKAKKQLLHASLVYARKNLAKRLRFTTNR